MICGFVLNKQNCNEPFFRHVERLRSAQKEYFRTRSPEALRASKRLERELDAEIERVNKILNERQNPPLNFNEHQK